MLHSLRCHLSWSAARYVSSSFSILTLGIMHVSCCYPRRLPKLTTVFNVIRIPFPIHILTLSAWRRLPVLSITLGDIMVVNPPCFLLVMDACQTVKGQVVKTRETDTGRWETPVFRLWTDGKRNFPFVQCLQRELSSQCSMWTNGKFFLPLVQDMRGAWTSGKKRKLVY